MASGLIGFVQNSLSGEAPMTRAFLGGCLLVFALCVMSDHQLPIFSGQFRTSTTLRFGALFGSLGAAQPWRYLSAVFVHYNVLHVGMNCWVLSSVGATVERELGKARFVVLFVLAGVLGFLVSNLWYGGIDPPTAGASGAIFGLFGSLVGIAYARKDPAWKQTLVQNLVWVAILAFMSQVNNAAHVGGLLTGALLGILFSKEPRKLRLDLPFGLLAGLLLALSLASVVLSAVSPVWRIVRVQENSREVWQ
ncbi:MAG: rhomboid family intramembrane serine protease [Polyangiaceae bacterium]